MDDDAAGIYRGPEPSQPNLSTSRTPDKWARFSGLLSPSQGAYKLYQRRIYRPDADCRMRESAVAAQHFCPVCEDAIAAGLLRHLTEGSGRLQPPLELDVELTWPFMGRRRLLTGAGIGPGGRVPQLPLPYLEVDGDDLRVAATVTVLRAAVPAPYRPAVSSVVGLPRGLVRLRVEGTHPNVGFPDGVEASQAADLQFAERLEPEDFGFRAPSSLRQVAAGRTVPVGGEVRAEVDRDTGDFRTDVALSAVSAGRVNDDLRLRSWTLFTLTQLGRSAATARRFSVVDPAEGPRVRHVAELGPLEVGHYEWRVESRLAAHEEAGSEEDRPGPWRLGSAELDRGGTDFHFAVVAPERADAPPRVPVPLAAGRVQVTVVVHREGSGRFGDWSRSGFVELGLDESAEIIGRGHVPRIPVSGGLIGSAWRPGVEPPDIGAIERFLDRLPPREVVRMRSVVMIARSWSRAFESLRMEFQVSHDGGAWADVAPSPLALRQRDTWLDPDAPGLSAKVVYWEYADDRGDAASRWRCRAIDRSGRTSRWSPPAPLLDFNVEAIPARLGVPL